MSSNNFPSRVVDGQGRGWFATHPYTDEEKALGEQVVYRRGGANDEVISLAQLGEKYGPWRPVVPMPEGDHHAMVQALTKAGKKAAGTLAVAVFKVAKQTMVDNGMRPTELLIAGRPGSWEADALRHLAWSLGSDIKLTRTDMWAGQLCEEIITRWITDPDAFVEVAEGLASVFGDVVDAAGGWDQASDQWLRRADASEFYRRYLCSLSEHYGPTTF
ncbi:hypothetical protein ACIBG8_54505 [Nonomuraea sp. NPDC050556]|uniref:hypothetical protein n=1 Tax=Nonomuraea sp. NPDC050556 TaxID=3364369 RepID=UPI0037A5722B